MAPHALSGNAVDVQLFKYLGDTTRHSERPKFPFRVPSTVVFRVSPVVWYDSLRVPDEHPPAYTVRQRVGGALSPCALYESFSTRLAGNTTDIVCLFVRQPEGLGGGGKGVSVSYMTREMLSEFLFKEGAANNRHGRSPCGKPTRLASDTAGKLEERGLSGKLQASGAFDRHGFLQQYVPSGGSGREVLQAVWTPVAFCSFRSVNTVSSDAFSPSAASLRTFDGPISSIEEQNVSGSTERLLRTACESIAAHVSKSSTHTLTRVVAYFKISPGTARRITCRTGITSEKRPESLKPAPSSPSRARNRHISSAKNVWLLNTSCLRLRSNEDAKLFKVRTAPMILTPSVFVDPQSRANKSLAPLSAALGRKARKLKEIACSKATAESWNERGQLLICPGDQDLDNRDSDNRAGIVYPSRFARVVGPSAESEASELLTNLQAAASVVDDQLYQLSRDLSGGYTRAEPPAPDAWHRRCRRGYFRLLAHSHTVPLSEPTRVLVDGQLRSYLPPDANSLLPNFPGFAGVLTALGFLRLAPEASGAVPFELARSFSDSRHVRSLESFASPCARLIASFPLPADVSSALMALWLDRRDSPAYAEQLRLIREHPVSLRHVQ
ncbi:hypothetical protein DIPPA_22258 [Diplonema papillatum]|nr:hypothetical protein DIPPA_22258 [Diplonema papillatum]|eukprot:gene5847-8954_t